MQQQHGGKALNISIIRLTNATKTRGKSTKCFNDQKKKCNNNNNNRASKTTTTTTITATKQKTKTNQKQERKNNVDLKRQKVKSSKVESSQNTLSSLTGQFNLTIKGSINKNLNHIKNVKELVC